MSAKEVSQDETYIDYSDVGFDKIVRHLCEIGCDIEYDLDEIVKKAYQAGYEYAMEINDD